MSRPDCLDAAVLDPWLAGHHEWRLEEGRLVRVLRTKDYPSTSRLFEAQVATAERLNHHPEVTIGYRSVRVELWTHDREGITQLDLDYAEAFDQIVATSFAGDVETI
ncbi:MAG: 4a-hydroxytetrahydrobiopterin dehydratase [Acidimicrobiales bacterium]